jgi:hypothetical protein
VDHQPQLVDHALGEQRADQGGAAGDRDVLARCCFSLLISPTTSLPSSVESCQLTSFSVLEATYFGESFMAAAIGSSSADWPGQNAANSS